MRSTPKPSWLCLLWQDISGNEYEPMSLYYIPVLKRGYRNLPRFLKDFCYLYYKKQLPLKEVARTLQIHEELAKQRWVVSISLFKILLAVKPKNPV